MPIKIHAGYDTTKANTVESVVLELVKAHGRSVVSTVASLTDSSGGTAGTLTLLSTSLANAANSGTNLAGEATSESALGTVKDALLELATKANEYATKLGITNLTYSGGGTAVDGTVAAVTVSVTAAATGIQATETNAIMTALNDAFYKVAVLTNKLARATGKTELALTTSQVASGSVAALSTDAGAAADPGITKAAFDAELVKARTNVATLAAKLNELNDGLGNAAVVAV
jgi:hypothetical protein